MRRSTLERFASSLPAILCNVEIVANISTGQGAQDRRASGQVAHLLSVVRINYRGFRCMGDSLSAVFVKVLGGIQVLFLCRLQKVIYIEIIEFAPLDALQKMKIHPILATVTALSNFKDFEESEGRVWNGCRVFLADGLAV